MRFRLALLLALSLTLLFASPSARAQSAKAEAAATALDKKAMDDYLQTDFNKAQDKLERALRTCEGKCNAGLRARLHRDLGVIQIGGAIDKERGINHFVEALKIDPGLALDPDVRTKDLDAAFADAKRRVTGNAPPSTAPTAPAKPPEGDFQHTAPPQQQVRTAIPLYAEYSGSAAIVRVIARYKGFGMTEWKNVELKKMGDKGWGGLVPCADVQQGLAQYYLQGFDANNDPVATSGDRNNPYRVQVVNDKLADPPHLPNAAPPEQCPETGDCPPNFPGCKKGKGEAASSSAGGKDGGEFCEEAAECKSNRCERSRCADGPEENGAGKHFWIGLSGTVDYSFIPSAQDVCKLQSSALPINSDNYYCVDHGGNDYPSRDPTAAAQNSAIVNSADHGSDKVSGGGALGNIRIMVTADYAFNGNLMLGARFGFVFNNYPGAAAAQDGKRFSAPIHLEARLTYVLGNDPLWKKGLAPYFMVGAGLAPYETSVAVQTIETPTGSAAVQKSVVAWHIAGPGFVTAGGGGRYAFSPRFALLFGLRVNGAFGNAFAPSVGPEVGGQVGF